MKIKRWIGVLLCMLLCVGMLPATVFAANEVDTWDGTVDTSWYDESETEFHLQTAEQLAGMAELLEQNMYSFKGKTIYLEVDVDLQNKPWNPIGNNFPDQSGNNYNRLSGAVFNGNGHTVYNLLIDASKLTPQGSANCGLFGFAENSSILNLGIEGGRLINTVGGFEDGLLAGKLNDCNVSGCYATGTIEETANVTCVGGLIGQIYNSSSTQPVVIEQCYADVTITASVNAQATIGGFCTGSLWSRTQDLIIKDCYSAGSIISESEFANVAGFAAAINWMPVYGQQNPTEASRGVIENCYSVTDISSKGFTADFAINDGSIRNCCWISLSEYGCLEGMDKCTVEDSCVAYTAENLPEESLEVLNANREDSPWVGFAIDKGPVLLLEANQYSADYSDVDEAITKAKDLNKDNYKNYADVEAAISAVIWDKNIAEQTAVDAMAKAIEDAIAALEYKDADYQAVDAAIEKANALNKDEYKDFSGVEAAIAAVVRDKDITEQAAVNEMAKAIENAIAALEYKDADYSKVDEAIAKADALNPDDYTNFSAVEAAINAVVRGKDITEQDKVDDMALAIENAIANLENKPATGTTEDPSELSTDTDKPSDDQTGDTTSPETGDDSNITLWMTLLLAAGAGIGVTAVSHRKRRCKTK